LAENASFAMLIDKIRLAVFGFCCRRQQENKGSYHQVTRLYISASCESSVISATV